MMEAAISLKSDAAVQLMNYQMLSSAECKAGSPDASTDQQDITLTVR